MVHQKTKVKQKFLSRSKRLQLKCLHEANLKEIKKGCLIKQHNTVLTK